MYNIPDSYLHSLYRYPVKGLTGEKLDTVQVRIGQTFPFDRAYAIENGPTRFNPQAPTYLPKTSFLMLMRQEKLAKLNARFRNDTHELSLYLAHELQVSGKLNTLDGQKSIIQFIQEFMVDTPSVKQLRIVHANGHSFSDVANKCVHIVNLDSIRALEQIMQVKLDPLRFRANIYLEGLPAWEEFNWINQDIALAGIKMHVFSKTVRCFATNIDPKTGIRDQTNIPDILQKHFGHANMGIYANILEDGVMHVTEY